MKTKLRFSISLTVCAMLSLSACTSSKSTATKELTWSLALKKGGCLDVCQSYTISIQQNGNYEYKGNHNVKYRGKKSGKLSPNNLNELNKRIQAIDWKSLETTYGNQANDSQRKELNYSATTINKNIIYYRLEPQGMRDLEHFIDTLINHDEF